MTLDVQTVAKDVKRYLGEHGFKPRDADLSDLQCGEDTSLRFKVGTTRGEVAIQVVQRGHASQVIRILSEAQAVEVKYVLDQVIHRHWNEATS